MTIAAPLLRAGIVEEALFSFPANTEYLEYDNLAALRKLPEYKQLREKYSNKSDQEAVALLRQLGVAEAQVREVMNASDAKQQFGLLSGSFGSRVLSKRAASRQYASTALGNQIFCVGGETCLVFLQDSLAAFGSPFELERILQVRRGVVSRLSSNVEVLRLLNANSTAAPVRGVLVGSQLQSGIASVVPAWTNSKASAAELTSRITGVGYSVVFDNKAHVSATIDCSSTAAAFLITETVSALAKLGMGAPFQNVELSNSANRVYLKAAADPAL